MDRRTLGDILANQLIQCVGDRAYGYTSSMDPKYSHLNEQGMQLMQELMSALVPVADAIRREEIKNHAQNIMIEKIKG